MHMTTNILPYIVLAVLVVLQLVHPSTCHEQDERATAAETVQPEEDRTPNSALLVEEGSSSNHPHLALLDDTHDETRKGLLRQRSSSDSSKTPNAQWWPWDNNNGNDTSSDSPEVLDHRCSSHTNCTSCTESSFACHWCSRDNQCHAKGSWYGCAYGDTCSDNSTTPDKADTSCHSHKNCAECTLSSSLCHFCAFDNQCHAIGSVYGCSYGVNCYSNDRCERKTPEPIVTGLLEDVGVIPLVLILSAAMGVLCCSSILYAGANALQGAYDDLVRERVPPSEAFVNHGTLFQQLECDPILEDSHVGNDDNDEDDKDSASICERDKEISCLDITNRSIVLDDDVDGDCEGNHGEKQKRRVPITQDVEDSSRMRHDDNEEEEEEEIEHEHGDPLRQRLLPVSAHPDPTRLPTRYNSGTGSRHIKCMMRTCGAWYAFTVFGALFFVASSILLFPKVPEVNVCSDELAWKSIIDGLTSLKVQASFEILTSVKNKNRLDMALEGVAGKFKHDGQEVGTFEIKPTTIAASAISDVLVTCTVVPDRWEALGLVADYYKGTLQFLVDISGSVRIKGIGFSIPVKMTDILIKANKNVSKEDRHLCACPQWKDLHPTPSPVMSFEEAIVDPVTISRLNETQRLEFESLMEREEVQ